MNIYGMMTAVCLYRDTNISARVLVLTAVPVRAAVAPPRLVRSSLSGLALMGHTDCANSKARRVPR